MSTGVFPPRANHSRVVENTSAIEYSLRDYLGGTYWFAVWTKSRQKKVAAAIIAFLGITNFLPLKSESRQWSDRKQTVDARALFSVDISSQE